ncbi:MAG: CHAD domain-containing protein [Pseudomonadota bacterium]
MPTKSKQPAPIKINDTTSESIKFFLKHNFEYLIQWEETARSWDDIEGVHQMRVSFRKIRSMFSLFQQALPKSISKYWNEEIRWIGSQLGLARDLDVFIDEGLEVIATKLPFVGKDKLLQLAENHRSKAYHKQVCIMLDSKRYTKFKTDFEQWYEEKAWEKAELNKKNKTHLEMKLLDFSRLILDNQERKVLRKGSQIDRESATEMHQLRIECKKLRYAAEFFQPIFLGMEIFIKHLKGIQDILGILNDVSVMHDLLELLLGDSKDHELLEFSGAVIGWRTCEYYMQLKNFDSRWDEFTDTNHPWWKKSAINYESI